MESGSTLEFSLKTSDALNKAVSRYVLQEKLESLVGVLHITRRDMVKQEMSVTPRLQTGSFRDSDMSVRLGH